MESELLGTSYKKSNRYTKEKVVKSNYKLSERTEVTCLFFYFDRTLADTEEEDFLLKSFLLKEFPNNL